MQKRAENEVLGHLGHFVELKVSWMSLILHILIGNNATEPLAVNKVLGRVSDYA